MSGITPVLDTLLHQVLGRRVDIPLTKDLNQPAGPVVPVEGARPLHSDSRLDARSLPQAQDSGRAHQAQAAQASLARSVAGGAPPSVAPAGAAAPSSTVTSFSSAARAIADLLQRFPVPASAIAPATPLLAEAPGETLAAALIAARLQQSIQHSGLFYESHVARWYRGELPLEALRHEPQMQVVSRGVVGSAPAAPLPGGVQLSQSSVSGVVAQAAPAETAAGRESGVAAGEQVDAEVPGSLGARAEAAGVQQESLSSLLRQQLELLAVPQLRWEGNVWVGVFMSLVIEARQASEGSVDEEGEAAAGDHTAEREWKVRLGLRLSGHGALEASISLQGEHLALTLHSESAGLRRYFEDTRSDLQERLAACGFSSVHLQLHEAPAEDASHG